MRPMARSGRVSTDDVVEMTVGEVMIANPKTLPGDALVADVRRAFEHTSVRTVLLADDGRFRGAIERAQLPGQALADEAAGRYADPHPVTATPAMSILEAIERLQHQAEPRLIVLDEDGSTLRGLLCFNRTSDEFCVR
jgi:CBS domain-containing protein